METFREIRWNRGAFEIYYAVECTTYEEVNRTFIGARATLRYAASEQHSDRGHSSRTRLYSLVQRSGKYRNGSPGVPSPRRTDHAFPRAQCLNACMPQHQIRTPRIQTLTNRARKRFRSRNLQTNELDFESKIT